MNNLTLTLKRWYLTTLCISLYLLMASCSSHKAADAPLNKELYGRWSNDNHCSLILRGENDKLILYNFINTQTDFKLHDLTLTVLRNSVYTIFYSPDNKFKAIYADGTMTIDRYCLTPLHKVGNE